MPTPPSAPPAPRGQRKREKTRTQLIAAGRRVLAARGEAFSVTDVVTEADVSNGTFYNYFVDRAELLDALTGQLVSELAARAAVEIETSDPALRFATTSARVLAKAADDPIWGRVALRLQTLRAEAQEHATRYLREDLALGLAQGRFDVGDDDATLDLVGGTLLAAIQRIVNAGTRDEYAIEVLTRLLAAVGVPRSEGAEIARQAARDAHLALARS